jgi:hypothetical protein
VSGTTDASTPRGRPCSAQREGNVPPATPLDRHTGRVALATSDRAALADNSNAVDLQLASTAHPAGSRGAGWRPPPGGSGAGGASDVSPKRASGASEPDSEEGAFFTRYSVSKCSTRAACYDRPAWLREVGILTRSFRAERAMRHRGRARYMLDTGRRDLAKHHLKRADGQRRRFETVEECGTREVLYGCEDCGHQLGRSTARCSHHRLCIVCRGHRARRYRVRFRAARRRALETFEALRTKRGRRLDWRERMLTLTIPHSGDVRRDLKTLPRAWKLFRRWLWLFFEHEHRLDKELLSQVAFMRVTETTAGRKGDGHAHYHVYLHSPYIPHELIRHLWGKALRQLGYATPMRAIEKVLAEARSEFAAVQLRRVLASRRGAKQLLEEVEWPVIDIEEAYGDIERELVKYLVKDAELEEGAMKLISPALGALVYEGLEGLRTIATSRHFFENELTACACDQCGSTRIKRVLAKPPAEGEAAESPAASGEEASEA